MIQSHTRPKSSWLNRLFASISGPMKMLAFVAFIPFLSSCRWTILDPKGTIAYDQKQLLIFATLLMLIVVLPVIVLTVVFAWKYRQGNQKVKYRPEWSHNTLLEIIWWGVPCIIIAILAYVTWVSTHRLDPYVPLESSKEEVVIAVETGEGQTKQIEVMAEQAKAEPVEIQVVALDWKFLFIYPEYNIATVNEIAIPTDIPIKFRITAQAPMNSFMIPKLGSQIYAMEGMQTKLYLMADEKGIYRGRSTNYSGKGFAHMNFKTKATTFKQFRRWIQKVKNQGKHELTMERYQKLAEPSRDEPVSYYSSVQNDLFVDIIKSYVIPPEDLQSHHYKEKEVEL
jgi:cytochrome o ubiquinol oxidase subunit 2